MMFLWRCFYDIDYTDLIDYFFLESDEKIWQYISPWNLSKRIFLASYLFICFSQSWCISENNGYINPAPL